LGFYYLNWFIIHPTTSVRQEGKMSLKGYKRVQNDTPLAQIKGVKYDV